MVCLDDYFANLKENIALIKIDVQGSEPLVIKGMSKLLKKIKAIVFEFWPEGLINAGSNPKELLDFLRENNFKLFNLNPDFIEYIPNTEEFFKNFPEKTWTNILAINENLISSK